MLFENAISKRVLKAASELLFRLSVSVIGPFLLVHFIASFQNDVQNHRRPEQLLDFRVRDSCLKAGTSFFKRASGRIFRIRHFIDASRNF
jgi:hypothetical protein